MTGALGTPPVFLLFTAYNLPHEHYTGTWHELTTLQNPSDEKYVYPCMCVCIWVGRRFLFLFFSFHYPSAENHPL